VVNPRTPRGFADPVPWFTVDGGLNEGIVLGEARGLLTRADYASLRGRVWWNDREMQGGVGSNALGGADLSLTWLANYLNGHGIGLQAGEIITTGVITEFFFAGLGDTVVVEFEHLGRVTVGF
jgi:2-keto-4-pentenoate hydratase